MPYVVCNSGPLMALAKLNRIDVLRRLWDEVVITRAVYDEVVTLGLATGAQDALVVRLFWQQHDWPIVEVAPEIWQPYLPEVRLDAGERETLAYAAHQTDALVLLDDELARREARRLGLPVKGTLGVIAMRIGVGFWHCRMWNCSFTRSKRGLTSGYGLNCVNKC